MRARSESEERAAELLCDVAPLPCVNAVEHLLAYHALDGPLPSPKEERPILVPLSDEDNPPKGSRK